MKNGEKVHLAFACATLWPFRRRFCNPFLHCFVEISFFFVRSFVCVFFLFWFCPITLLFSPASFSPNFVFIFWRRFIMPNNNICCNCILRHLPPTLSAFSSDRPFYQKKNPFNILCFSLPDLSNVSLKFHRASEKERKRKIQIQIQNANTKDRRIVKAVSAWDTNAPRHICITSFATEIKSILLEITWPNSCVFFYYCNRRWKRFLCLLFMHSHCFAQSGMAYIVSSSTSTSSSFIIMFEQITECSGRLCCVLSGAVRYVGSDYSNNYYNNCPQCST